MLRTDAVIQMIDPAVEILLAHHRLVHLDEPAVHLDIQVHVPPAASSDLNGVLHHGGGPQIGAGLCVHGQPHRLLLAERHQKFLEEIMAAAVALQRVVDGPGTQILHKRRVHKILVLQKPDRQVIVLRRQLRKILRREERPDHLAGGRRLHMEHVGDPVLPRVGHQIKMPLDGRTAGHAHGIHLVGDMIAQAAERVHRDFHTGVG